MYWSRLDSGNSGRIFRAEMDGSNPEEFITGLNLPNALAIDFVSRRLFWTDYGTNQIKSSDLNGSDVQLVIQLKGENRRPTGIQVNDGHLVWSSDSDLSMLLRSSDEAGHDVRTLYKTDLIHGMTIAKPNPVQTRRNDCEGQKCSPGICVLNRNSFRCIEY